MIDYSYSIMRKSANSLNGNISNGVMRGESIKKKKKLFYYLLFVLKFVHRTSIE